MSYITTYTGKHFDPIEINAELIDIRDIAHALSLLCRTNGHLRHFYSVAQHCVNCCREAEARGYSEKLQFACLLHDAAEAYLSDVTRPVKTLLPEYQAVEDRLLDVIWEKYVGEVTETERKLVFEIDDAILSLEFKELMPQPLSEDYKNLRSKPQTEYRNPLDVENDYLRCFEK
ncbi:MAG: phosphohydrolase [Lachnospiraceae bacterium]|nr:phosphohydrolase [Lachnospiraceae bacterium]